jgi:hypothetical protein
MFQTHNSRVDRWQLYEVRSRPSETLGTQRLQLCETRPNLLLVNESQVVATGHLSTLLSGFGATLLQRILPTSRPIQHIFSCLAKTENACDKVENSRDPLLGSSSLRGHG